VLLKIKGRRTKRTVEIKKVRRMEKQVGKYERRNRGKEDRERRVINK
jgi:hypothetical protein